ncbi:GntR family transcriptional regulator [Herbiconiux moechotypicola]|uniref:GntR family transcriptional regulator n=1 Tax=Herbiconiux moechotypicola TaxID=637393 RepID=A0ABN3DXX0_9MICO|nr:GntR family transcriptional regulator [Herbiconiux moechotypicola]MCS5730842.1 GntR family transcriptional regulator [Herbiconiux moechotypicola]
MSLDTSTTADSRGGAASTGAADRGAHGAAGARVAAELRDAILAGVYPPGARIRQEDVAGRHGASRVPAREALRMLEAEGLVTVVANTGAWVTRLNLAECEEIYQVRERLEPLLLRYNVPLLGEDGIDALELLATRMEGAADIEVFLRLDREFHLSCYEAAPTTMLGDTVLRLWNRTQPYRRAYTSVFRSEGDRSVHHEHHLLVAALRRRDAEEAERVLASHIRRTRLELARHPEIFDTP